ncbi:ABC transporter permease [Roseivirga sp. BDSF3-8]|uniref:ABC transporter permease n=1 Tax=Roseivirga sp. BDSF3-8 TaxID=3241598 RepID=UPI0035322C4E
MKERWLANFFVALEAIMANKVRSILTALGIIFGVAAVIAMLAIGRGAQQEILEQIKLVGVNNIIITPVVEQTEGEVQVNDQGQEQKKFTPGLTLLDVQSISDILPSVASMSPEVVLETYFIYNGMRRTGKLVGISNDYFDQQNFEVGQGSIFSERQMEKGEPVCIIGYSVKARFFAQENPIGKRIKCGPHWLEVVGVMEERMASQKALKDLGIRDVNMDVYTPINTMLIRYENRAKVTSSELKAGAQGGGPPGSQQPQATANQQPQNYHQVDRLVVQVADSKYLSPTAEVLSRMLKRRHYGVVDYEITIPELLLKQEQRTKKIFNMVLFAIAAISLLVGGIGIMNIMLASILERIREIGLRLALGAKKTDIVVQFVFESVMISVTGGLIGILLGVVLAIIISRVADIPTIISVGSIFVSFGVAAGVGLIFGIAPARKAAGQNPINSLRYE